MAPLFTLDPAQLTAIADSWQAEGRRVADLDFDGLPTGGCHSATAAALLELRGPAGAATDEIGDRLISLGQRLNRAMSTCQITDAEVADGILDLPER